MTWLTKVAKSNDCLILHVARSVCLTPDDAYLYPEDQYITEEEMKVMKEEDQKHLSEFQV